MNHKPLCIASVLAAFVIACALEGGGLSAGQAALALLPACVLMLWSFWQTDWCEPTNNKSPLQSGNSSKGRMKNYT